MLDAEGRALRDELVAGMGAVAGPPPAPDAFDRLAARVFTYNHARIPAYAAYCRARGVEPGRDGGDDALDWRRIPAVPTAAFKELRLLAAGATAEAVFRTSGTTRGPERRGEHPVADLSLYRASLRATFRAFLLPDAATLAFVSLIPSPEAQPDSSLAFMAGDAAAALGGPGGGTFADAAGVDFDGLEAVVAARATDGLPMLLLGTSAAFIHWLDRLAAAGRRLVLPDGSRLMDTGGFKGRGRQVSPAELRQGYADRLGLPPGRCVNEYGMTEMLSQLYDASLAAGTAGGGEPGRKRGGWWVRSVAVDPETLDPLEPGRPGLLRHLDLANIGSVAAIQTEDWGTVDADGAVAIEGRAPSAAPRGCSVAMDLLLEGAP